MEDKFIPYHKKELSNNEQLRKSEEFYLWLNERRSVRDFSDKPVDILKPNRISGKHLVSIVKK